MFVLEVAAFQHPGDGVRDGEQQSLAAEHGMFAADALDLGHDVAHLHTGAQGQGHQTADGFGLGRDGAAGLADGGEDLEGFAVDLVDGQVHGAQTGLDLLGEALHHVGALAHHAQAGLFRGRGGFAVHLLLAFAGGQHLQALAAVAVHGDALAAFLVGQPVDVVDVLFGGAVGQVHGLGHGVVGMALEGGLHAQVPDGVDVHGRDEDLAHGGGQGIQGLDGAFFHHLFHEFGRAQAGFLEGGLEIGVHFHQALAVQDVAGEAEGEQGLHARGAAADDGQGARGRDGGDCGIAVGAFAALGEDGFRIGREGPALFGQTGRGGVAFGIDEAHDAFGQGDARLGIIGDAQLEEEVGKAHDAQADLAVAAHGLVDALQREARGVDDVVQEAHGQVHHLL